MAHFAAYREDDPSRFQVRRAPKRASATVWFLRATTACFIIAGAMVLGDMVLGWTRNLGDLDGRTADPTPMVVFVGSQRLTVPANMFRFENQRTIEPQQQIDLAVHWPSLEGYGPGHREAFIDGSAGAPLLFMTVKKRDTATDSAGRLANVYQHFFEPDALPAPEGLIGRTLSEDSGLGGEEVYFEAGSTTPFTTHCLAPDGSGYPAPCLTEIHAGENLSVQIRFRKGLLADWAAIKSSTRGLLMSFGVAP